MATTTGDSVGVGKQSTGLLAVSTVSASFGQDVKAAASTSATAEALGAIAGKREPTKSALAVFTLISVYVQLVLH